MQTVINAEYAAYKSPKFTQPMARAREGILSNLVERVSKHVQSSGLSQTKHNKSPSTSSERSIKSAGAVTGDDVVPTASRSSMIKEGIANLGRRRSGQSSDSNRSRQTKPRKSKASKAIEGELCIIRESSTYAENDVLSSTLPPRRRPTVTESFRAGPLTTFLIDNDELALQWCRPTVNW